MSFLWPLRSSSLLLSIYYHWYKILWTSSLVWRSGELDRDTKHISMVFSFSISGLDDPLSSCLLLITANDYCLVRIVIFKIYHVCSTFKKTSRHYTKNWKSKVWMLQSDKVFLFLIHFERDSEGNVRMETWQMFYRPLSSVDNVRLAGNTMWWW